MTKKDVKINYIYNLLYQMFIMCLPLVTIPYLSRVLRPDGIGIASYIDSIVAYFTLFAALSIATYGRREISYAQDDAERRSIVFWEVLIFKVVTTTIALICYALFVKFAIDVDKHLLYWIKILPIIMVVFDTVWFFQGLEEFKKVVFRNFVIKVIWIIFIFTFVKTKDDLALYLLGQGCIDLAGAISLWFYLPQYVKKVERSKLHPFRNTRTILLLFVPAIAVQVYTVLDKTMIGVITQDAFQNGYYEQAIRISKVTLSILTAMSAVMAPRIGHYFQKGETELIKQLVYRGYRFVWFLGVPMCLGLMCVAPNFVPWFLGSGYDPVIPLLQISALLILAIGLSNVTGTQYLLPRKCENLYTKAIVTGAVSNFGMNIFLIKQYQALGAMVASAITEVIVLVCMIWLVRKELSPIIILKLSVHYLLAGAVMAVVLLVENTIFVPSIGNTCIMIGSGAAAYFVMLTLLRDSFFFDCCKSVLQLMLKSENKKF